MTPLQLAWIFCLPVRVWCTLLGLPLNCLCDPCWTPEKDFIARSKKFTTKSGQTLTPYYMLCRISTSSSLSICHKDKEIC